ARITLKTPVHLIAQIIKALLCFFLVILPISVAWLPTARRLNRAAWLRFAGIVALVILLAILASLTGRIDNWLMPWLLFLLSEQSSLMPGMFGMPVAMLLWIRLAISLLVIASALILVEQMVSRKADKKMPRSDTQTASWKEVAWILVPFSFSYALLLAPRGAFYQIQDRYLVGLVPIAIVLLLRLYQERIRSSLSAVNLFTLALFAAYSIAGTHDFFAESRAEVVAIHMVESSGVPRRAIQTGFPSDGWV